MAILQEYIDNLIQKGFSKGFKDKKELFDLISNHHQKAVDDSNGDPKKLKVLLKYY